MIIFGAERSSRAGLSLHRPAVLPFAVPPSRRLGPRPSPDDLLGNAVVTASFSSGAFEPRGLGSAAPAAVSPHPVGPLDSSASPGLLPFAGLIGPVFPCGFSVLHRHLFRTVIFSCFTSPRSRSHGSCRIVPQGLVVRFGLGLDALCEIKSNHIKSNHSPPPSVFLNTLPPPPLRSRRPLRFANPLYCQIWTPFVKSNQIKSDQIKSNQIKSNQIKSNQIKSNQLKSKHGKITVRNKCWWRTLKPQGNTGPTRPAKGNSSGEAELSNGPTECGETAAGAAEPSPRGSNAPLGELTTSTAFPRRSSGGREVAAASAY